MTLLWFAAFVWTIALELPVYVALTRFRAWWMPVAVTVGVNALTHPLLWFVFPRIHPFAVFVLAGEASVIAVEALILAALGVRRPLVVSFAANATSAVLGWLALQLMT